MGDNLTGNIPMPSSADLAGPTDCFRCQFTPTNSDSSSITVDTSKHLSLRCDDTGQGKSTEWTNEKHSRYLDSLEASFVDELYHSMRLGGWGMKKNSRVPYSSDQVAVLGDECWKKINYERNEPLLDSTADSRVVIESPWLPHFMHSSKRRSVACPGAQEHVTFRNNGSHSRGKLTCVYGSARSLEHNSVGHKCHQDLVGTCAEVSDQNFVDIPGGNSSHKSAAKRLKTAASGCSSKDQVIYVNPKA